jgi:cell division protein FtsB
MVDVEANPQEAPHPMFRFTIRDVIWLTIIAAISISWRMDSHNKARYSQEETELIASTNLQLEADNAALAARNQKLVAMIKELQAKQTGE